MAFDFTLRNLSFSFFIFYGDKRLLQVYASLAFSNSLLLYIYDMLFDRALIYVCVA